VRHFQALGPEALRALHVRPLAPGRWQRGYNRYVPDKGITPPDEISLLGVPVWPGSSAIKYITFRQQRLQDPAFDPLDAWGGGRMTFNSSVLGELIHLLKL
jgi:hypothetical protein